MIKRFNENPPDYYAKKLLQESQCTGVPIDVRQIASNFGIIIEEVESDYFEGFSARSEGKAGILINSKYKFEKRKRFTIAHELGHIILPYHNGQQYACTSEDMVRYYAKDEEVEANEFAAELLMPSDLLEEDCKELDVNLTTINQLSDRYNVSKCAASLRFVDFTYGNCAVVFIEKGVIKSFKASQTFNEEKLFIAVKNKVSPISAAGKYFYESGLLLNSPKESPANIWISEKYKRMDFHIWEQSFEIEAGKLLLTFIWTAKDYETFCLGF